MPWLRGLERQYVAQALSLGGVLIKKDGHTCSAAVGLRKVRGLAGEEALECRAQMRRRSFPRLAVNDVATGKAENVSTDFEQLLANEVQLLLHGVLL